MGPFGGRLAGWPRGAATPALREAAGVGLGTHTTHAAAKSDSHTRVVVGREARRRVGLRRNPTPAAFTQSWRGPHPRGETIT